MTAQTTTRRHIRATALPAEHGGWGFLLEPALLGLLLAPSWSAVGLIIAVLGVFLLHHPLKLALKDRLKQRRTTRTRFAERFALFYGLLALVALALVLGAQANSRDFLTPLLLAVPFGLIQLYYESRNQGRANIAEIAGALALGALAPAVVMLDGWNLGPALSLWLLLAVRTVTSISYVRAKLRLEKGRPFARGPVWLTHGAGLACILTLILLDRVPWLTVLGIGLLAWRAMRGLAPNHVPLRVAQVGIREMLYGITYVVLMAAGWWLT